MVWGLVDVHGYTLPHTEPNCDDCFHCQKNHTQILSSTAFAVPVLSLKSTESSKIVVLIPPSVILITHFIIICCEILFTMLFRLYTPSFQLKFSKAKVKSIHSGKSVYKVCLVRQKESPSNCLLIWALPLGPSKFVMLKPK